MSPTPTSALESAPPLEEVLLETQLAEVQLEPSVEAAAAVAAVKTKPKQSRSKRAAAVVVETAKIRLYQLRKPSRLPRAVPRGGDRIYPAPQPVAAVAIIRYPPRRKPPRLPLTLFHAANGTWVKPPFKPAVETASIRLYSRRKPPRLPFTLLRAGDRIQSESKTTASAASVVRHRKPPRLPLALPRGGAKVRLEPRAESESAVQTTAEFPARECNVNIKRIVEAILFAADKPLSVKQIQQVFPELEQPDTLEIQDAIESICQDYLTRPIGLQQLASGWRFQVKEGMAYWVGRLFEEKPPRYSRAMLETIAIIAYRQPVTRGEIEDIRGVAVSTGIIHTLLEREWIRIIAHKEAPGRPALYGTTKQFLDYFNLSSLTQLPTLEELAQFDFSNTPQQLTQQDTSERPQTSLSEAGADYAVGQETQQTAIEDEAGGQ